MIKEPRRSDFENEEDYNTAMEYYEIYESDREEQERERYYEEKYGE